MAARGGAFAGLAATGLSGFGVVRGVEDGVAVFGDLTLDYRGRCYFAGGSLALQIFEAAPMLVCTNPVIVAGD